MSGLVGTCVRLYAPNVDPLPVLDFCDEKEKLNTKMWRALKDIEREFNELEQKMNELRQEMNSLTKRVSDLTAAVPATYEAAFSALLVQLRSIPHANVTQITSFTAPPTKLDASPQWRDRLEPNDLAAYRQIYHLFTTKMPVPQIEAALSPTLSRIFIQFLAVVQLYVGHQKNMQRPLSSQWTDLLWPWENLVGISVFESGTLLTPKDLQTYHGRTRVLKSRIETNKYSNTIRPSKWVLRCLDEENINRASSENFPPSSALHAALFQEVKLAYIFTRQLWKHVAGLGCNQIMA
ncbi:hypothetical protein C8R43DRAFT_953046 [Mycena crocata]|nr:hypothetical protein C8R43DRAFT_953046 [Mycena crocata]